MPLYDKEQSIHDYVEHYHDLSIIITTLKEEKEEYDNILGDYANVEFKDLEEAKKAFSKLNSIYNNPNDDFTFIAYWKLYETIKYLINHGKKETENLKKLHFLSEKLIISSKELHRYLQIKSDLLNYKEQINKIFTVYNLDIDDLIKAANPNCTINHVFAKNDNNLKCVCCSYSTENDNLSQKDIDFLSEYYKRKNRLLEGFQESDMPLITVAIADFKRNLRKLSQTIDEDDTEAKLDYFSIEDDIGVTLQSVINAAHHQDLKRYNNEDRMEIFNPKYLDEEQSKELLERIEKDIKDAESLDNEVESKKLFIETCKTIKYEILILSGNHIPTLYEEAKDEDEKICVAKAYFNLSNIDYLLASEYFSSDLDALRYCCKTASPEINNQIIKRRVNNY